MTHPERGRGPGTAGLVELSGLLSPRDWAVMEELKRHRFLTTTQLERLLFHDHATIASGARTCRRTLQRLLGYRLIERLHRRVGGLHAGSSAAIWSLSSVGQRLRSIRFGDGGGSRFREPSQRFVEHYLAVAETLIRISEAARAGHFELTRAQLEPGCWRTFLGRSGGRVVLSPDLFVVTASGDYEDHWFIEVDLGTEHVPTLLRKCAQYELYRASGQEQDRSGGVFPLVLWLVQSPARQAKLLDALHASTGLEQSLYRVATSDELIAVVRAGAGV